ncbi:MAG TPA: NB-ARC domain-containing protein [Anaerolineae bacterium]|nr:NB-ARC domain-containing protein [Anaerolineae bacterium]HQH36948.1 NB-ARC domain-containing protein [Anaerolineae bacterium]
MAINNSHDVAFPADFVKRVHQALKAWHTQSTENMLTDLVLTQQTRIRRNIISPRLLCNQILMYGMDELKSTHREAYELLQRRFLNKETAQEVAYSRNITVDVVYQHQRLALEELAQAIWSQELEARAQQARRIAMRLEFPTYTRLFGVVEKSAELCARLETFHEPWIVALEGMGGVGKTALADALVRTLAHHSHFQDIAWLSARQRLFRSTGMVETLPFVPTLTLTEMVDRLIDQFDLGGLKRQTDKEKFWGLKDYLKSQPCLVVIDNLETIHDYYALIPALRELANPGKFLLTTRYSLRGESGVYLFPLQGLAMADALALVRYEAELQGLTDLATATDDELGSLYTVTGGNPLAIKLIVGQTHTFPLSLIIQRLGASPVDRGMDLLDFIHADAWKMLSSDHRRIMQALTLAPDGGGRLEQLAAASGLPAADAVTCLRTLTSLSLVMTLGGLSERRYALHPLTRTFVLRQKLEELPDADDCRG